jgi:uncharacterized protein HemY
LIKYLVTVAVIILGIKYGISYLESDDFQRYGDEQHAEWTCHVNNLLGQLYLTMSHYDQAMGFFLPVMKRCPKTPMSEEAMFRVAICLEQSGHRAEAANVYTQYALTYKGTERAKIATRAAIYITNNP